MGQDFLEHTVFDVFFEAASFEDKALPRSDGWQSSEVGGSPKGSMVLLLDGSSKHPCAHATKEFTHYLIDVVSKTASSG